MFTLIDKCNCIFDYTKKYLKMIELKLEIKL